MTSGASCFTPVSLARRWRCRPSKVRDYLKRGLLIGFLLSDGRGTVRITPEEVERFEQGRPAAQTKPKRKRPQRPAGWEERY